MKVRISIPIIAVAVLSLLVSCYWQAPVKSGSLSFSFSPGVVAKSISQDANTLRVYLVTSQGTLYPLGKVEHPLYDEIPSFTSSSTYNSPLLPVGQTFSVIVVVGKSVNGAFAPTNYSRDPATVTIAAGVTSSVSITLQDSPFTRSNLWGKVVTGLAVIPNTIYASTADTLSSAPFASPATFTDLATLSDRTINSLSIGSKWVGAGTFSPEPWMNTTKGVVPFHTPGGADTSFATGDGIQSVLLSASLNAAAGDTDPNEQVIIYQRLAGIGGEVLSSGTTVELKWFDVDLSAYLTGKPILDFVATENFAYFATSLGALQLPKSITKESTIDAQKVMDVSQFFSVTSGEPVIPIISLALAGAEPNYTLYMGTTDGVYSAPLVNDKIGDITPVSGTAGRTVSRIAAYDQTHVAFLARRAVFVFNGTSLTELPYYSGLPADLPGELTDVSWFNNGATITLLVAGKKGLVSYAP
jgi:hypothetical protein